MNDNFRHNREINALTPVKAFANSLTRRHTSLLYRRRGCWHRRDARPRRSRRCCGRSRPATNCAGIVNLGSTRIPYHRLELSQINLLRSFKSLLFWICKQDHEFNSMQFALLGTKTVPKKSRIFSIK